MLVSILPLTLVVHCSYGTERLLLCTSYDSYMTYLVPHKRPLPFASISQQYTLRMLVRVFGKTASLHYLQLVPSNVGKNNRLCQPPGHLIKALPQLCSRTVHTLASAAWTCRTAG